MDLRKDSQINSPSLLVNSRRPNKICLEAVSKRFFVIFCKNKSKKIGQTEKNGIYQHRYQV